MIFASAVLAVSVEQSHAQTKPPAEPALPYGVSRQESSSRALPDLVKPVGVTEARGEPKGAPSIAAEPRPTPPPPDPLWHLADARSVGAESAHALNTKYQLPATPQGMIQASPIGWLSVVGLLGLVAVSIVLGQRNGKERDQKVSRRRSRPSR